MTSGRTPAAAFGLCVLTLGAAVIVGARHIKAGFSYDVVGPAMFPTLIGAGLMISGAIALFDVWRKPPADAGSEPLALLPVALISGALLLEAAFIRRLGWILVVAAVFAAGTFAFSDRRIVLNSAIGLALGAAIMLAFSHGLGIDLPTGPLEALVGLMR
jgi:putative tricarboxylic transport membrane protein